jgi:hypothetical protein
MPEIKLPQATDIPAITALVMPFVTKFLADIAKLPIDERQHRIARVLDALSTEAVVRLGSKSKTGCHPGPCPHSG